MPFTKKYHIGWMIYYIDQSCTPSFPIGLVKTESDFIVRLVETGLGRLTLAVSLISVDAYLFSAFSDLTCHLDDSNETKLGSRDQEASP